VFRHAVHAVSTSSQLSLLVPMQRPMHDIFIAHRARLIILLSTTDRPTGLAAVEILGSEGVGLGELLLPRSMSRRWCPAMLARDQSSICADDQRWSLHHRPGACSWLIIRGFVLLV